MGEERQPLLGFLSGNPKTGLETRRVSVPSGMCGQLQRWDWVVANLAPGATGWITMGEVAVTSDGGVLVEAWASAKGEGDVQVTMRDDRTLSLVVPQGFHISAAATPSQPYGYIAVHDISIDSVTGHRLIARADLPQTGSRTWTVRRPRILGDG